MTRSLARLMIAVTSVLVPAAAYAAGGEGKAELMPSPMDSKLWYEALWTLIVFLIFFSVLSFVVWPKILGSLRAREEKQRGDLKAAEDAAREAKTTLAEYRQQLAEAQKQSQQIIEASRKQALDLAAQLKSQAEQDARALMQRNSAEIKAAKEQAIAEIYEQAADMATRVAGKILSREISAADQAALVSQSLNEIGTAGRN